METGDPAGVRFEGDKGWVFVQRGDIKASDPDILRWKPGQGEIKLVQSGNHMKNFLESVRSRKDPVAPVEVGHRSNTICIMTHIAMKLGRKLAWDPAAETLRRRRRGQPPARLPAPGAMGRLSPGRLARAPLFSLPAAALGVPAVRSRGGQLARDDAAGRLTVLIGGREAVVYQYGADLDLPHYWPMRSPSGKNMLVEKTEPYPHHRSFWFADTVRPEGGERDVSFYNALYSGVKTEAGDYGPPFRDRIRHVSFTRLEAREAGPSSKPSSSGRWTGTSGPRRNAAARRPQPWREGSTSST